MNRRRHLKKAGRRREEPPSALSCGRPGEEADTAAGMGNKGKHRLAACMGNLIRET